MRLTLLVGLLTELPIAEGQTRKSIASNERQPSSHVDFAGKPAELTEFIKALSIGDRIRVFCYDGVVVAKKISQTQFKEIHAETMAESVH